MNNAARLAAIITLRKAMPNPKGPPPGVSWDTYWLFRASAYAHGTYSVAIEQVGAPRPPPPPGTAYVGGRAPPPMSMKELRAEADFLRYVVKRLIAQPDFAAYRATLSPGDQVNVQAFGIPDERDLTTLVLPPELRQ